MTSDKRWSVEAVPHGSRIWGAIGGYYTREDALRIERRMKARGWYKRTRVVDVVRESVRRVMTGRSRD